MSTLPILCAIWHAVLWILMDLKNQWVDVTELMLPWRYYVPVLIAMATGSQWSKKSQNLKNNKLVSLYDNVPFIFECFMIYNMLSSVKNNVPPPPLLLLLLFLLFFVFFGQASSKVTLSRWVMHKTAAFHTE